MGFSKIFSFSVIRVTIAAKSAFVYTPFIQRIYWDQTIPSSVLDAHWQSLEPYLL